MISQRRISIVGIPLVGGLLDSVLTVVVFVPFSLMVLFYFLTIMRQTLEGEEQLTTWKAHAYFFGIVLIQIGGLGAFAFAIYLVLYVGIGL